MLDVCLLGTAGMMPLPNRWLTALSLKYNGSNILIDCGENADCDEKWNQFQADRYFMHHPLSCRPYQRIAGASSYNGKCRAHRAAYHYWT